MFFQSFILYIFKSNRNSLKETFPRNQTDLSTPGVAFTNEMLENKSYNNLGRHRQLVIHSSKSALFNEQFVKAKKCEICFIEHQL